MDRTTLASKDDEAFMSNIRTPSMNETLIFVFYIYSKTNLFHIVWNWSVLTQPYNNCWTQWNNNIKRETFIPYLQKLSFNFKQNFRSYERTCFITKSYNNCWTLQNYNTKREKFISYLQKHITDFFFLNYSNLFRAVPLLIMYL